MSAVRFARVGVVTGLVEELATFHADAARTRLDGDPVVDRIDVGGRAFFLCCAGIGKVAAATAATTLRERHEVDLLVVIGTAGDIGAAGGGPFLITEAVQSDYGAQRPAGLTRYTPGEWPIGAASLTAFHALEVVGELSRARIATSDLFIECGTHAAGVRDALGVTLVDMETAAVAQAAALLGIPWLAIKATTDEANEDSVSGFQANLARAARSAAMAMEELLAAL